ncbi:hypothetical protein M9H77_25301 [Catharanthus roseus]|uniref:Uncharacterized protein n=1 Tax=Catharanthus roseus TaxID=4058 RepID=A0ACC0A932_CATRO|nr:hypothetical protein M9H77_25301 [Catharanthus roseus]
MTSLHTSTVLCRICLTGSLDSSGLGNVFPHTRSQEARRPTNNRMYVVRNLFVKTLWLEALSHLLTKTWTSVPAIPPSACTDDYMQWFLPRSHPWIQNPVNIPRGFHVPADPPMPPQTLVDLIAREARREDARKEEKFDRMLDLLTRHYRGNNTYLRLKRENR